MDNLVDRGATRAHDPDVNGGTTEEGWYGQVTRTNGTPLAQISVERQTGMQVGSKRDAYRAANGDLAKVGAGLQRTVYVDDTMRTVYKVANWGWDHSNREEYEAMYVGLAAAGLSRYRTPCALFTMPDGTTVLAMPYRVHHGRALSARARDRFYHDLRNAQAHGVRVPDMHDGNYRGTPAGRVKITDLGFGVQVQGTPGLTTTSV